MRLSRLGEVAFACPFVGRIMVRAKSGTRVPKVWNGTGKVRIGCPFLRTPHCHPGRATLRRETRRACVRERKDSLSASKLTSGVLHRAGLGFKSCSHLIQVFLEPCEHLTDVFRPAQVSDGVSDRVLIFEAQKWGELGFVQFAHALPDIMRQHEIEEHALLTVEMRADL